MGTPVGCVLLPDEQLWATLSSRDPENRVSSVSRVNVHGQGRGVGLEHNVPQTLEALRMEGPDSGRS